MAAMDSLSRLRQRRIAFEIRDCAVSAECLVVKWRYIDDMIDCMDPGDDFQPWPEVLRSICNGLSPVVVKLIDDRLKKRRKELHDELIKERHEE
jgi:hypothetical protein